MCDEQKYPLIEVRFKLVLTHEPEAASLAPMRNEPNFRM
jgi:hypothetical protein